MSRSIETKINAISGFSLLLPQINELKIMPLSIIVLIMSKGEPLTANEIVSQLQNDYDADLIRETLQVMADEEIFLIGTERQEVTYYPAASEEYCITESIRSILLYDPVRH